MKQRYDDGRVIYPFGRNVDGRIFYGADKSMFCAIQKGGRAPFNTGKQWTADDSDKARAYDDYLTYCGRYEIDGDTVTRHVAISLYPDWTGNRQVRKIRLADSLLHITAHLEDGTGENIIAYLGACFPWLKRASENRRMTANLQGFRNLLYMKQRHDDR